jgi:hypothetical protein
MTPGDAACSLSFANKTRKYFDDYNPENASLLKPAI